MSRDHRNLRVFQLADQTVKEIYRLTVALPATERYGLQLQLRRAAVSVATNIVEGAARRTTREYLNFLNIATGSAAETHYLLDLSRQLELLPSETCVAPLERLDLLVKSLKALTNSLEARA